MKSDCVRFKELSMCTGPKQQHSAAADTGGRRGPKQRKAFISMSPNLFLLYVRVQARTGGRGALAQWHRAQWGHSSPPVHTHTQGDSPPGVPKWSNTSHRGLITPVPKDRKEE